MDATVLVVDDQEIVRRALATELEDAGFDVVEAGDGKDAWECFQQREPALVVTDVAMPRSDGLELLGRIRGESDVPVIVFTAYGTVDAAVSALKSGADEFVSSEQLEPEEIVELARRLCGGEEPSSELEQLQERLVGKSAEMEQARQRIAGVASLSTPVLIEAEDGSGRRTVARAIHDLGPLFEGEFKEYEATTFSANRRIPRSGTVYIRNIEELTERGQKALADLLVASAHKDLRVLVSSAMPFAHWATGHGFQPDLVQELARFTIRIPPLRERTADIADIVEDVMARAGQALGRERVRCSAAAVRFLASQSWPGNVAQLAGILERCIAYQPERVIGRDDVARLFREEQESVDRIRTEHRHLDRDEVIAALRDTGGNIARTAELLGRSRQAIYRIMAKHGIQLRKED